MSKYHKITLFIVVVSLLAAACDNKQSCEVKRTTAERQLTLCLANTNLIKDDAERSQAQDTCYVEHKLPDSCVTILASND